MVQYPNEDLLADTLPGPSARSGTPPRLLWHLATNQLNLMFMLGAGLVLPPKGFGHKYYTDILSTAPGWIPLFPNEIPRPALDRALSEGKHLRSVVAEMDLSRLRGEIDVLDRDGSLRKVRFPDGLTGAEQALFIPAPLPAPWIRSILFASKADKTATEEEAADYANVPLKGYKRRVKPGLFKRQPPLPWPPPGLSLPDRDESMHRILGIGATQAMMLGLGNTGDAAATACRQVFDPGEVDPSSMTDPMLSALQHWVSWSQPSDADELQSSMLSAVLERIIQAKSRADIGESPAHPVAETQQAALDCLESQQDRLEDERLRTALDKLRDDLRGILGLGGKTVSELLQRHSKPFSRALILFFLRDDCADLLAFRHGLLTGMDYVAAAALFAARAGWMGIPLELRNQPGLEQAVTHRMAAVSHRVSETGLDLGPPPARCRSLRERLAPAQKDWSRRQQAGALELARGLGWNQVMHTRVSLGKGEYRLQLDGGGAHILLDGEVKAVTTEIDRAPFFELLGQAVIPVKLELRVRAALGA